MSGALNLEPDAENFHIHFNKVEERGKFRRFHDLKIAVENSRIRDRRFFEKISNRKPIRKRISRRSERSGSAEVIVALYRRRSRESRIQPYPV
jgi:hypothetical protein